MRPYAAYQHEINATTGRALEEIRAELADLRVTLADALEMDVASHGRLAGAEEQLPCSPARTLTCANASTALTERHRTRGTGPREVLGRHQHLRPRGRPQAHAGRAPLPDPTPLRGRCRQRPFERPHRCRARRFADSSAPGVPRRHLSKSRNIGIEAAAGEVVAFIDDDAIPEPRWLEDLVAAYDAAEIAGVGGLVYDHTGCKLQYRYSVCDRLGEPRSTSTAARRLSVPRAPIRSCTCRGRTPVFAASAWRRSAASTRRSSTTSTRSTSASP